MFFDCERIESEFDIDKVVLKGGVLGGFSRISNFGVKVLFFYRKTRLFEIMFGSKKLDFKSFMGKNHVF